MQEQLQRYTHTHTHTHTPTPTHTHTHTLHRQVILCDAVPRVKIDHSLTNWVELQCWMLKTYTTYQTDALQIWHNHFKLVYTLSPLLWRAAYVHSHAHCHPVGEGPNEYRWLSFCWNLFIVFIVRVTCCVRHAHRLDVKEGPNEYRWLSFFWKPFHCLSLL